MKISYDDKVDVNDPPAEEEIINTIMADDMNHIKTVVNKNFTDNQPSDLEVDAVQPVIPAWQGLLFTNRGTVTPSGSITVNLPKVINPADPDATAPYEVAAGAKFRFVMKDNGPIHLQANNTDRIQLGATDAAEIVCTSGRGGFIELTADLDGFWLITGQIGTWVSV